MFNVEKPEHLFDLLNRRPSCDNLVCGFQFNILSRLVSRDDYTQKMFLDLSKICKLELFISKAAINSKTNKKPTEITNNKNE